MTFQKILLPYKDNEQVRSYVRAVQAGAKQYHVKSRQDKWIVKKLMTKKLEGTFNTKKEAENFAVHAAKQDKTDLFIYGRDGYIQVRRSYK